MFSLRRLVFILSMGVFLDAPKSEAQTVGRLQAFVFGNSSYTQMRPLPSAAEDARQMATLLRSAGFILPLANDPSGATINMTRQVWCEKLQRARNQSSLAKAELVVLYYAGHGGQVGKSAYLMGIDASVENSGLASDLRKFGIDLQDVISDLKPTGGMGMVAIIDACLSGPAEKETPSYTDDVLAIFSTSATKQALDGKDGQSSVFTAALTSALRSQMSFGDALKEAEIASLQAGNRPMAKYSPTSDLARFRLPAIQPVAAPVAASTIPATPETAVGSDPPAWLYLTDHVKTGLTLRPEPGDREHGELIQDGDGKPVAVCFPAKMMTDNKGAKWLPVECEGWVLAKNLKTGKEFIKRSGNRFTVLGEVIKARFTPKLEADTPFKLEPNALGILLDEATIADEYQWQRIKYEGWVTLIGLSGKEYATYAPPR